MDSESNYKSSLLILPRYPRDSETFMRCGFLKLIRLSAEAKHSYNFLFLIPPVLCWQGKEAEGQIDEWKSSMAAGERCSKGVLTRFTEAVHRLYEKQTSWGLKRAWS